MYYPVDSPCSSKILHTDNIAVSKDTMWFTVHSTQQHFLLDGELLTELSAYSIQPNNNTFLS